MTTSLTKCPTLMAALSVASMAVGGLLFLISVFLFLFLTAAAVQSTRALFSLPWTNLPFAAGAWGVVCLAGYNVVRSLELINKPDRRGLGWILLRLALLVLLGAIFGPAFWWGLS